MLESLEYGALSPQGKPDSVNLSSGVTYSDFHRLLAAVLVYSAVLVNADDIPQSTEQHSVLLLSIAATSHPIYMNAIGMY